MRSDCGEWKHAKLCPSTDPMRFAWEEQYSCVNDDEEVKELIQLTEDSNDSATANDDDDATLNKDFVGDADDNVSRYSILRHF